MRKIEKIMEKLPVKLDLFFLERSWLEEPSDWVKGM